MKILLLGGGGREHALAWKLAQSRLCEELLMAQGSAAMQNFGTLVELDILDPAAVSSFAKAKQVGLCVIGPEAPLAAGVADALRAGGIPVFGPDQAPARLEASKDFAKQFMLRHGVATAEARSFDAYDRALDYALTRGFPVVVKADGLAAGKGVTVAEDRRQLEAALSDCFKSKIFGSAGSSVLIEDFMAGEEVSLLCFSDGKILAPMVGAQDHKRVFDADQGPNTGGMGAYSPAPVLTEEVMAQVRQRVLDPTLQGLKKDGLDFRGCLYVGLMVTPAGPKVVEYNVRFGDPETQVVVPRMDFDLGSVMLACAEGRLDAAALTWKADACACVVLASQGYPGSYLKGREISGLDEAAKVEGALIFHAGSAKKDGRFVTTGGRVLGVTATGKDFKQAIARAYEAVEKICFEGVQFRRDIGHRALARAQ
jgi:phosphoribosylamine--glycine ligase